MNLEGKVLFITGAAGGIGKAAAKECLKCGAKIAAVDIAKDKLEEAVRELSALGEISGFYMDATNRESVKAAVAEVMAKYGRIDGLYNNAGINRKNLIGEYPQEDYDAIFNVNLKGAYFVAAEVAKVMIEAGKGRIINMSSIAAIGPEYSNSVYCMTKAAISKLTECMVLEWGGYGISPVAIAPGKVNTSLAIGSMKRLAAQRGITYEEEYKNTVEAIPAKRLVEPEEIGYLVAYLFDERSYYIMGNTILVSGGVVTH